MNKGFYKDFVGKWHKMDYTKKKSGYYNSNVKVKEEEKRRMKYISFAIPCYNSQDYMAHAIESILPGGEDIEIIIVNDGSKDRTSEIAHEYMEKYPTIVKVVDKENGGHGDAVNSGLAHASGKYFKVVDSDDWVDEEALQNIRSFTSYGRR